MGRGGTLTLSPPWCLSPDGPDSGPGVVSGGHRRGTLAPGGTSASRKPGTGTGHMHGTDLMTRARRHKRRGSTFFLAGTARPLTRDAGRNPPRKRLRAISTARLRTSPPVHLPPINVVVFNDPQRDLILWLASRLDAFSAYPYPTRLPSSAPGGTTGAPEVGPTRSSRTSVRATQISNAHNR